MKWDENIRYPIINKMTDKVMLSTMRFTPVRIYSDIIWDTLTIEISVNIDGLRFSLTDNLSSSIISHE